MKDEVMTANTEMLEKEIGCLENELLHSHRINPNLYIEYDVKRGLRDSAGKGVLTGLTEISDVNGYAIVEFNNNAGTLEFDTININKVKNYGFSVITPDNKDIAQKVTIVDNKIVIECNADTKGCRVRYGANGEKNKSGRRLGARGNLVRRCPSALASWCYMFDEATTER